MLLDDLSQITFVLDNMSQKRSDMFQNNMDDLSLFFSTYLDNLSQFYFGRFGTLHICHNFSLDVLSEVI